MVARLFKSPGSQVVGTQVQFIVAAEKNFVQSQPLLVCQPAILWLTDCFILCTIVLPRLTAGGRHSLVWYDSVGLEDDAK